MLEHRHATYKCNGCAKEERVEMPSDAQAQRLVAHCALPAPEGWLTVGASVADPDRGPRGLPVAHTLELEYCPDCGNDVDVRKLAEEARERCLAAEEERRHRRERPVVGG